MSKIRVSLFTFLTAAMLALVLFIPSTAKAMPYFEDATVLIESVDVMIRPSEDSGVVTTLDSGARIGVFCEEIDGWYRIIYGNYRGYVQTDEIFLPSTDYISGLALRDGLVVRANPASGGDALGTLNVGYPVRITNILGTWYKVEATDSAGDDIEGYVAMEDVMQTTAEKTEMVLQQGMEGAEVAKMQKALTSRGFYGYSASGEFTSATATSLKKFQKHAGVEVTGVADQATLDILYSDEDIHSYAQDVGVEGSVMVGNWWSEVQYTFAKGDVATVRDVATGKTFQVQRYSGHNHADCEPLTAEDTATFLSCYGGSWSWNRRAIWVTIGSTTYAASMNGYPHGSDEYRIYDNNFAGHFCIHFKDSYGHSSNAEDSEHQAAISTAYYASIY
jgi:hypothetical protein